MSSQPSKPLPPSTIPAQRWRQITKRPCYGTVLVLAIFASSGQIVAAGPVGVLVPAYFAPGTGDAGGDYWDRLATAASSIPVDVILNPNSGPGTAVDEKFVAAVDKLRGEGGKVFGYVSTDHGTRNADQVHDDIDKYALWYHIDGIFVDEMYVPPEQFLAGLGYYSSIYTYIKSKNSAYTVIGNPGTNTPEAYLTAPADDVIGVFEGTSSAYQDYVPDPWAEAYSADHFAHLVYSTPASSWRAYPELGGGTPRGACVRYRRRA